MIDKAALLAPTVREEDFEIPGKGTVRIRRLNRRQAVELLSMAKNDRGEQADMLALSWALVDPQITAEEAAAWNETAGIDDITPLLARIYELAGIAEGADKSSGAADRDGGDRPGGVQSGP
ncbi:MAG TPA: hypothetical protein VHL53_16030 [Acidimicrobiia bacterium]|nr:hypothetical protein [Acidimicrobiia bacterium]